MSSTYTVGKFAAAFRSAKGQTHYVLFEQTFESNVFPRTPRWSCIYLGPLAGAMRRIFRHGSLAEGGMLKNRNRTLTPESYIAAWLKQLAVPAGYPNHRVRLGAGTNCYAAIHEENRAAVMKEIASSGRDDLLAQVAAGSMDLGLYEEAELISDLIERGGIPPWHVITSRLCAQSSAAPELGYKPPPAKDFELDTSSFLAVDADHVLQRQADGSWSAVGCHFQVVARYVEGLWQAEMDQPGSYRTRIADFRDRVKSARRVPLGTRVRVDLAVPLANWQRDLVNDVRVRAGAVETDGILEFEANLADRGILWQACRLPQECTSWIVPDEANQEATQSHPGRLI